MDKFEFPGNEFSFTIIEGKEDLRKKLLDTQGCT